MKKTLATIGTVSLLFLGACGHQTNPQTNETSKKPITTNTTQSATKDNTAANSTSSNNASEPSSKNNTASSLANTTEQTISILSKTIDEENSGAKIDIKIPQVQGMKDTAKQNEINQYFLGLGTKLLNDTKSAEKEMAASATNGVQTQAEGIMSYTVELQNNNLFSILITSNSYTGGAHGTLVKYDYTYDVKNHKILSLKDLFTDNNYIQTLSTAVNTQIQQNNMSGDLLNDSVTLNPSDKFYLTKDSVVVVFDPYEYTDGAAGAPEFPIAKSDLTTLNPEYK